ncbi:hypothetical protein P5V15_005376 [Pogonomyrmex californicus]
MTKGTKYDSWKRQIRLPADKARRTDSTAIGGYYLSFSLLHGRGLCHPISSSVERKAFPCLDRTLVADTRRGRLEEFKSTTHYEWKKRDKERKKERKEESTPSAEPGISEGKGSMSRTCSNRSRRVG